MTQDASLFGLTGKKALIIGGGQGMGEASALFLARAGCDVALVDLVEDRAAKVARAVAAVGRSAHVVIGDVLDDAQVPRIVDEAESKLGGLDAMVSIVGAAAWGSVLDTTPDVFDQQIRLNLRYFFLACQAFARSRIRRGQPGAIVGIASVDGQRAAPMRGVYGAAKAGLISLVQTMAVEWAPHNIRVNAVAPGHIVTPRLFDTPQRADLYANSLLPMRQRGTPDDIGKAALFLASDLARYITGTTLDVDGGLLAANLFPRGLPGHNG
ncbi:SDR family NAD(P)-dependent oxidoreductase [Rhodopila sp.]|jgi:NAD(P)-dependent dehydrogenase (short-subunit alcohol dehydrogenase family)|uniref:SDR family NAD(P)-dependent oxidoreductase n=1 Tax=Rhodopila sp. TaxID=2480087 RepID=UPI002C542BF7|nr:SDR family NAD(P)-dependent oxidoreductase [Rhodopila sp.]HVZ09653.1 SDR family NAD(P)-dependent oxidoreductase [Rhodopila sp.]